MVEEKERFPKDFLWGASVSAHQVEGGNHNQWTQWELTNQYRLAKMAEKQYSWLKNWPAIKDQAQDPKNYISGQGVDHYNRYKSDFAIAKKLNLNALRFGIEWSRIEPEEGKWNEEAITRYRSYIAQLKQLGIQPVINLWHWTMPVWFAELGGFEKRRNIRYFERFVKRIAKDLIVPCGWVLTINEPNSYMSLGYLDPRWPPNKRSPIRATLVFYNLALAHRAAYIALKKIDPSLQIGVATQCGYNQPKRRYNLLDRAVAFSANYYWNWWFLNRIRRYQDFVGFNYYFSDYFKGLSRSDPTRYNKHHVEHRGPHAPSLRDPLGPRNDMGWYMEPASIYKVIIQLARRYKKPIIVTETGVADAEDQYRQWWLEETLTAVRQANEKQAHVIGYFVWSLLDNFEWDQGWWPKFGLVKVDREKGMRREIRDSAKWFASFIASNRAD